MRIRAFRVHEHGHHRLRCRSAVDELERPLHGFRDPDGGPRKDAPPHLPTLHFFPWHTHLRQLLVGHSVPCVGHLAARVLVVDHVQHTLRAVLVVAFAGATENLDHSALLRNRFVARARRQFPVLCILELGAKRGALGVEKRAEHELPSLLVDVEASPLRFGHGEFDRRRVNHGARPRLHFPRQLVAVLQRPHEHQVCFVLDPRLLVGV
mmetsp:Transcript_18866/g.37315  ORF Transcript_18866/g.37315 Transcript_18866/m.37315 type:complete len:209 (+) Transcript_18866:2459-3085(+)